MVKVSFIFGNTTREGPITDQYIMFRESIGMPPLADNDIEAIQREAASTAGYTVWPSYIRFRSVDDDGSTLTAITRESALLEMPFLSNDTGFSTDIWVQRKPSNPQSFSPIGLDLDSIKFTDDAPAAFNGGDASSLYLYAYRTKDQTHYVLGFVGPDTIDSVPQFKGRELIQLATWTIYWPFRLADKGQVTRCKPTLSWKILSFYDQELDRLRFISIDVKSETEGSVNLSLSFSNYVTPTVPAPLPWVSITSQVNSQVGQTFYATCTQSAPSDAKGLLGLLTGYIEVTNTIQTISDLVGTAEADITQLRSDVVEAEALIRTLEANTHGYVAR